METIQLAREGPKFLHTLFTNDDIILFVGASCKQAKVVSTIVEICVIILIDKS